MADSKYNPYEDQTLHIIQPEPNEPIHEREGFNDVMKYYDTIQGYQNPKQLGHIPTRIQQVVRWAIIVCVGIFLGFVIYQAFTF
ncbi:MAG: hypothetical protein P0Y55_08105 [Candidatus Cohnella colombiensis]|uniref:Uncharacterized protein n=1 Tax=Candidatus Cohnella colombiensis TaxID=3121368 RepID=A0AA95F343_9BACL|nr:MAG: hypothetical protein P0Y55_08105 [Cohnella sp.]